MVDSLVDNNRDLVVKAVMMALALVMRIDAAGTTTKADVGKER